MSPKDKGDVFSSTEIGKPVPAEHAFSADDNVVSVRLDRFDEASRFCAQVAVKNHLASVIENTEVHGAGVEIDAAVVAVFLSVESHRGLLLSWVMGDPLVYPQGMLRGRPQ